MDDIFNSVIETAKKHVIPALIVSMIVGVFIGIFGTLFYMDHKVIETHEYHVDYINVCDKNLYDVTAVDNYNWKGDYIGTDYY